MCIRDRFNATFLDELYFVAIRIFDKRDDDSTVFHRASLAHHFSAGLFNKFTGLVGIIHFKRNMAVGIADVITCGIPVVRQLNGAMLVFTAVANKSQRKFSIGII